MKKGMEKRNKTGKEKCSYKDAKKRNANRTHRRNNRFN